jgi:N-succinyldiaminopimelate aminotransferase
VNPLLAKLQPYPFEKLRALTAGYTPNPALKPLNLSIGEPKHPTPTLVKDALTRALDGLAGYPATLGSPELRQAIAAWLGRRYGIPQPDPETEVLPINGSREALFAFAQTVIDPTRGARVVCPNPFYQIYEGAAFLAGATPIYGSPKSWDGVQLLYVCSPANPSGHVMGLDEWRKVFDLADRHGFIIASDECYSEIYCNEPPLGSMQAARKLGRNYERLVAFSSLSKRSNAPGMRSGFVDDAQFTRRLHAEYNVLVLPGSYIARAVEGVNPGANHVRVALVPPLAECKEAMERISRLAQSI